jgi:glyoxylase-like metal-dependent hydrolase (beta-lactamase superfamily II)
MRSFDIRFSLAGGDGERIRQDARMESGDRAPDGIVRVRADNPSPMTLDGTNTYLVEGWVVDPGPDDEPHLVAVLEAAGGGIEGIAITHAHADHDGGAAALAAAAGGVPVVRPREGEEAGPLRAIATPGHSPDHVCLLYGRICFAGDAVAGIGSSFVPADGGGMAAYLDSLRRLRALDLDALCPGHGPFVHDPAAKLDEYIEHRLERERKIVAALERGISDRDDLLEAAWDDTPLHLSPMLRWAAGTTLDAHLEKLAAERRLTLPT